jgi:hypothetical protein
MVQNRREKQEARAYAAAHGVNYAIALRHVRRERAIRTAETDRTADMRAPHQAFDEYDPRDNAAFPCRCYNAGSDGWAGVQADGCLHPDEYLKGVQARYEHENDI